MNDTTAAISQATWTAVDQFIEQKLQLNDPILQATLDYTAEQGLPSHLHVANNQGKLLAMLLQLHQSKRVLELGTFAGYSTIYMAQHLPQDGFILSIEGRAGHAKIAQDNIQRAGFADKIEIKIGDAATILQNLPADTPAFDFIFIDADKQSYPKYLQLALQYARSGTVLFFDNVIRAGEIINENNTKPTMLGLRQVLEDLGNHPQIASCTALQTVGCKGYDGFALAIVK